MTKDRFYFFFYWLVMQYKIAHEVIQEVADGKDAEDLVKAFVEGE